MVFIYFPVFLATLFNFKVAKGSRRLPFPLEPECSHLGVRPLGDASFTQLAAVTPSTGGQLLGTQRLRTGATNRLPTAKAYSGAMTYTAGMM